MVSAELLSMRDRSSAPHNIPIWIPAATIGLWVWFFAISLLTRAFLRACFPTRAPYAKRRRCNGLRVSQSPDHAQLVLLCSGFGWLDFALPQPRVVDSTLYSSTNFGGPMATRSAFTICTMGAELTAPIHLDGRDPVRSKPVS